MFERESTRVALIASCARFRVKKRADIAFRVGEELRRAAVAAENSSRTVACVVLLK